MKMNNHFLLTCAGGIMLLAGCGKSSTSDIPAAWQKIYGTDEMYIDGDYIVVKCDGLPDHKSPYYLGTTWESSLYEAYNGNNPNFNQNPNTIGEQTYTFRIPLNPEEANTHTATSGGPMGVSLNGVPFFNQYAAMQAPLTGEINSFDQYGGHPAQNGDYHYHIEPVYLTGQEGDDALLGFLLDGFPVYGPYENGLPVDDSGLDVYHGHSHATADYPDGIYHYHVTATDPYINGDGYFGTPGTVTN